MSDFIQLETEDNVATLILNRPNLFNALNLEMAELLAKTCLQVKNDPKIRCLLIKGSGGNFLAGGDITRFKTALDEKYETYIKDLIYYANTAVYRIREMSIPVIASVEGSVAGYGLSLMLACDMVVATDDSKFITAYSLIGASPDGGMTYHLPRIIGTKRAYELCALSKQLNAQQAYEIGIVNQVVLSADLVKMTRKLASELTAGPQYAYGRIKQLINQSLNNDLNQQLKAEETRFLESFRSDEFLEGVAAFCEKRNPIF